MEINTKFTMNEDVCLREEVEENIWNPGVIMGVEYEEDPADVSRETAFCRVEYLVLFGQKRKRVKEADLVAKADVADVGYQYWFNKIAVAQKNLEDLDALSRKTPVGDALAPPPSEQKRQLIERVRRLSKELELAATHLSIDLMGFARDQLRALPDRSIDLVETFQRVQAGDL